MAGSELPAITGPVPRTRSSKMSTPTSCVRHLQALLRSHQHPGYLADHWCEKGHVLLCLEGELLTELADGRTFTLIPGTSYQVADGVEPHRSSTSVGAKLFVVD